MHAKDHGCTFPGCNTPGYHCEAHHIDEWAAGGPTNADKLTFASKPHQQLLEQGWTTRKRSDGTIEWIPPPQLNFGQPATNNYRYPERCLCADDDTWAEYASNSSGRPITQSPTATPSVEAARGMTA